VTARERAIIYLSIYLSVYICVRKGRKRTRELDSGQQKKRGSDGAREGGRETLGGAGGWGEHHNRASFDVTDMAGQEGARVRVSGGVRL
jgi:hypothetical protein